MAFFITVDKDVITGKHGGDFEADFTGTAFEGHKRIKVKSLDGIVVDEPLSFYDKDLNRIDNAVLVEKGLLKDYTGEWYNTENPREQLKIDALNVELPEEKDWTKEKPIENEPFQRFDKQKKKWAVDTKKKKINLLDVQIGEYQFYLDSTDYIVVRMTETGVPVEESTKEKRKNARERITKLRKEKEELEGMT